MLASMLERVAGAEVAIGSLAGGIESILGTLENLGRNVRRNNRLQSPSTTVPIDHERVNDPTPSPSEWQHGESACKAGGRVEDVTTPQRAQKQHQSPPVGSPATGVVRPILVDLDTTTNDSADNDATVPERDKTHETLGKRVHNQPRLRVVHPARKQLVVSDNATTGENSARSTSNPAEHAYRHKDPPRHDPIDDFGETHGPLIKPPSLQPKTHGVSEQPTQSSLTSGEFLDVG